MNHSTSAAILERARRVTPGGVNTSIRRVEPMPVWSRAAGSRVYDVHGREYIDYHAAFGPAILGHCHQRVNRRVRETLDEIDLLGVGTTEGEIRLAEKIVRHVPSAEMALLCNTGSEATHHAVRLSRAATGRRKFIKFQGCYHGWHDYLCMNVITPRHKIGDHDPGSAGMLREAVENTIVLPFNDLDAVDQALERNRGQVAGLILEPIPHNIGCVLPRPGYLKGLRELTRQHGVILTFDEVITGFRHTIGGYQSVSGVTPDLTTLGKSIANGYPIAAICGRRELMERFATREGGDVFFAGTYNGHPINCAAALATIAELEDGRVHRHIFRLGKRMRRGLREIVARSGIKAHVAGFGSVFLTYFLEGPVHSYEDLLNNDDRQQVRYRQLLLKEGIFKLPMSLKRSHIGGAHTEEDIDRTLSAAEDAFRRLVHGESRPVALQSVGTESGEPK